jgi:purine-binding chemotaxis protein CheW
MSTVTNNKNKETEEQDRTEQIDFKMVTFALAGKDYGIDIMKVKEIAKDNEFTYVPNTSSFVRGVYNLRGDIISIIDLRIMFNLPAEERGSGELENMIILRLDDHVIGVIVDSTDKVIGINSREIQPTHPLFGDINVKYISGVVENEGRLYIILDVERIFGKEEQADMALPEEEKVDERPASSAEEYGPAGAEGPAPRLDLTFITETLATFKKFYVSSINEDWVAERYSDWEEIRKREGKGVQLTSIDDAESFLAAFYSPYTGRLFDNGYIDSIAGVLPEISGGSVSVWNPGCGKGFETYSLACVMKMKYPEKQMKIWAHDSDLLNVSSAPALTFTDVPEQFRPYTLEVKSGYQFEPSVKDSILFEYHDITNENAFPPVDIVLARDVFSFLKEEDVEKLLDDLENLLKPHGVLIVGENEYLKVPGWTAIEQNNMVAFKKE